MNNNICTGLKFIEDHLEERITLELVANHVGYSKYHFARLFKEHLGLSVGHYVTERRLICAAKSIIDGKSITEAALQYGYDTHNGFGKAFKQRFGYPPRFLYAMRLTTYLFSEIGGMTMNTDQLFMLLCDTLSEEEISFDASTLKEAYVLAENFHKGQHRYSGEAYITHPLHVSIILAKMRVDFNTIILGLLHDCSLSDDDFARDARRLLDSATYQKLEEIQGFNANPITLTDIDPLKKEDILLVKLADRLHNMKTMKHISPSKWKEKSQETIAYFSPLAEKLGLTEMKLELDDLSIEHI